MVLIVVVILVGAAAAIGGGGDADADADTDPDVSPGCEGGGLDCALIDTADLVDVLGEEVEVGELAATRASGGTRWCDRPVPAPSEHADAAHRVTGTDGGLEVTVAVTSTVMRFQGADAALAVEAVRGLRQGCDWTDGAVTYRHLDALDVAGFGDEAEGALVRIEAASGEDNAELLYVRRGDLVAQLTLFPAQDDPSLWDALLRRADERLADLAP